MNRRTQGMLVCLALWTGAELCAAEKPKYDSLVVKGVKIQYLTAGKGDAVVLLHGLASSADLNWTLPGVVAELAQRHFVIALDFPGHGKSDKPEQEAAYGKQVIADVLALMDHLKVRQAHLVGYSLGGMVAMRMMVDHPDRVLSGTLGGMGWLQSGSVLHKFWEGLGAKDRKGNSKGFFSGIPAYALTEQELKQIKLPVKVIVGEQDPCRQMYVVPLQKIRPEWPVVQIKEAGHITCLLKPEFKQEISSWLKSL